MSRVPASPRLADESGFTLIEAVVAAVLLVLAMTATFQVLSASGRAGEDQRQRSQSYVIAQQDQARMRSLRISELLSLNQERTLEVNGTTFTVSSRGQFVSDATGTVSCDAETASADYVNITSTVDWESGRGHPPTVIRSIVAPPNGSIAPDRGTLAVAVLDGQAAPIEGIPLSGSGAGSFSGVTNENGCALFPNLPQGDYTLSASTAVGVVDQDGLPPEPEAVSVVGQSTNTVALQYDTPGTLDVTFETRVAGSISQVEGDSIVVFNTGMSQEAIFGTVGTRVSTIRATPLFPFASPDAVYAGSCTTNNPNPNDDEFPPAGEALAFVNITPNGFATARIQLPALQVEVRTGTGAASPGSLASNATVKVTDANCDVDGVAPKRTFTNTAGGLVPQGSSTPNPGLPYGYYDVCASNGSRRNTINDVPVITTDTDTNLVVYLGGGAGNGSSNGTCP